MAREFKGTIALDIRDSTPDWEAFLPDRATGVVAGFILMGFIAALGE